MNTETAEIIPIEKIWVNYACLGMDEGYPAGEAAGTLIHTMSHGEVVKCDATSCRWATAAEKASWSGPVSPAWVVSLPALRTC